MRQVIGDKDLVQLKQLTLSNVSYRIRVSNSTYLDLQNEVSVEKFDDEICALYQQEMMLRFTWRTDNEKVIIIINTKKVHEERKKWIKKLNPEFQSIQKEN